MDAGFEFKSYTCTGRNCIGEDVAQVIEIVQASVPAKPDVPTIKDTGHTDLTVSWTKPASDIEITQYLISYRDESGTEKKTTFDTEEIKLGDLRKYAMINSLNRMQPHLNLLYQRIFRRAPLGLLLVSWSALLLF